jgi:hypothetical protein
VTETPNAAEPAGPERVPPAQGHELEVDLAAFLPEGSAFGDPTADEPATDAEPGAASSDPGPVADDQGRGTLPAPSRPPLVDVAVLTRIEGELGAVDEALLAIDAGDPTRSPLLVELLGDQPDGS